MAEISKTMGVRGDISVGRITSGDGYSIGMRIRIDKQVIDIRMSAEALGLALTSMNVPCIVIVNQIGK